jgi:MFS family permease
MASQRRAPKAHPEHTRLTSFLIYGVTFLSGAVFLGLEIIASRVVAPFFGNSVYVWGSLISVFLLALSIGYFLGGVLADRMPDFRVLALIHCTAGVFVVIVPIIREPVGFFISGLQWDFRLSVLCAVSMYFLLPSILMGMVSPYIVKLKTTEFTFLGQSAGNVYAVSTVGSITGALLVSFVLITAFGTRAILWGSGAVLCFTGALCLVCARLTGMQVGRTTNRADVRL